MSIRVEDISYIYGKGSPFEKTALSHVDLTINKGEFIGVIGHTGSGKSTLIQHLNGLIHPTSGKVTIDGIDLAAKTKDAVSKRHSAGMVFQYPEHQLFEETIAADIAFGPRNLGLNEEQVDERVREAMAFVGLDYDTYATRSPFHLSGGQMRRVAIAVVIALNPSYLVLDEPSAGLDPFGREEIFGEVMRLHKEKGITVVLVSHNMEDISKMANRLLVVDDGKILLDGAPLDIFLNHRQELQAAGVDVPPVSMLMDYLVQRGLPVSRSVITTEEAAKAIEKALGEMKTTNAHSADSAKSSQEVSHAE